MILPFKKIRKFIKDQQKSILKGNPNNLYILSKLPKNAIVDLKK
ncbi:Hypothetical protein Minf_0009 [Methylacidiphilum infernorum V4]|uniref:Uncharacterized protein n=1 Tax=Methylacidiphilum infernorum (isolate V4) TaxID=481448 RepID=B3DWH4_METI4|nr:Hypothetical protein Minf_0009 [Methylacidiphilum infernorum V4]